MVQTLSRSEQRSGDARLAPLNAPLFSGLLGGLEEERRYVVLDLGPAVRETVGLFSGHRCRLDIVDLADDLGRLNGLAEDDERQMCAESLVRPDSGQSADLVLCWDLLNYLDRPALTTLMACVARRAHRGARVHALMSYAAPDMPALPNHYLPTEDKHLRVVPMTGDRRDSPRYSPEDLSTCMPAYRMERAMLLRNGMQEYLFRL
jgi:hypothetical protein